MAFVKPDAASFAKIKVFGVGGGGGNAINSMIEDKQIKGVEFVAVNTDVQALLANKAPTKIQIGENLTRGLGSGGDPEIGFKAAEESREKIKEYLVDTDMLFLAGGLGGGTGTGGMPVIAELARENGTLSIAVVTKPFIFEGTRRMVVAEEGLEKLKEKVDTLIVIPNQRIMEVVDQKMTLVEAFKVVDGVLGQAVQGISDIITVPGLINVDFADVRAVMSSAGSSLLGIGTGVGEKRAQAAARAAISSPLLDVSIEGAKGILFNIIGGPDLTMAEVNEAAQEISQAADADANIRFGAIIDEGMIDQVKIIVIATGFDETRSRLAKMVAKPVRPPEIPEGILGEKPEIKPPFVLEDKEEEKEMKKKEEKPKKPEEEISPDEFGEEFDIPAFLRQGK
jgi:cell division protein FtsZ